jgi:ankyrin repeat protein
MSKPTLSDQHWRLQLRRKSTDALAEDMLEAIAAGNQWRFDILAQMEHDPSHIKDFLKETIDAGRIDMFRRIAGWRDEWQDDLRHYSFAPKAAEKGHVDFLKMFIEEYGLEVDVSNNLLIRNAAAAGHAAAVKYLLSQGADYTVFNYGPLEDAAKNGHVETVAALLDAGADINMGDGKILIAAARKGQLEVVVLLLSRGADPALDDQEALWRAAENGHTEVVEILCRQPKIDVGMDENKALEEALSGKHFDCARVLIGHGADVNINQGAFLREAAEYNQKETAEFLLKNDADPNAAKDADTSLVLFARKGNVDAVEMMLDAGARADAYNNAALDAAKQAEKWDVVAFLNKYAARQIQLQQSEKTGEFARLFGGDYSLEDLRNTKGPTGETGLAIAAQTGKFNTLIARAKGGAQPSLIADDLYHPDDTPDCVLSHLLRHKSLKQFFDPDLWHGRREDIAEAWQALPENSQKKIDLDSLVAAVDHKTLSGKGKSFQLKPPKP